MGGRYATSDIDEDTLAAVIAVFAAVIAARKLPSKQRGAIVAALRDNGAAALAEVLIWRHNHENPEHTA